LKSASPIKAATTDNPSRARTLIKNVPVRRAIALTPKSGNFGGPEFFSDALKLTRWTRRRLHLAVSHPSFQ